MSPTSIRPDDLRPDLPLALHLALPVAIGSSLPALVYALDPTAAEGISPADVGLPAGVFGAIFVVIYAGMGMAVWRVRRAHTLGIDRRALIAAIGVGFAQTLLFWVSRGLPAILVHDLNSLLVAIAVVSFVAHYFRPAVPWLLPWLVWMFVTTGLKIAVLATGGPLF